MRKDKRLRKPTFPDNNIGNLLKQADALKYDKIYNYEYKYYIKTPNGFREDAEINHNYTNDRDGYEKWGIDNPKLKASYSGVTSVREIYNRENDEVIGCIFETKLNDDLWLKEIDILLETAWQEFVTELSIIDEESIKYFLFSDISLDWRDRGNDRINKFRVLLSCLEKYNDPEEIDYKKMIDKLKG